VIPVSIAMATFNVASALDKTLDSIFKQEYEPLEVVVVDDGSNDNTQAVCAKYPIRYIYLDRPRPTCQARALNVAIKHTTHENLIIQSSDVYHGSETILRLAKLLDQYPDSFVNPAIYNDGVTGGKHEDGKLLSGRSSIMVLYYLSMIKRQTVIDMRGVDEDFIYAAYEDLDFTQRLMHAGVPVLIDESITGYHQDHPRMSIANYNSNMDHELMAKLYVDKRSAMRSGEISHVRNLNREWGKL